jgi:HK97 gp10 family phage protein
MTASFVLDEAGLDELFAGPDSVVGKFVARKIIVVDRTAKRLAPVDTGRLRSSITWEIVVEGTWIVGRCGTNVHYAVYLEMGTRRMRARPFLRPALAAAGGSATP